MALFCPILRIQERIFSSCTIKKCFVFLIITVRCGNYYQENRICSECCYSIRNNNLTCTLLLLRYNFARITRKYSRRRKQLYNFSNIDHFLSQCTSRKEVSSTAGTSTSGSTSRGRVDVRLQLRAAVCIAIFREFSRAID